MGADVSRLSTIPTLVVPRHVDRFLLVDEQLLELVGEAREGSHVTFNG